MLPYSILYDHVLEFMDGSIWCVKGIKPIDGYVIAHITHVPTSNVKSIRYRFLRSAIERARIISRKYRWLVSYIPKLDMINILIPLKMVKVYDPREAVIHYISNGRNNMERIVGEFISLISRGARVSVKNLGLSGGYAVYNPTPYEPLEVVVYGLNEGLKVYNYMRRLMFGRGIVKPLNEGLLAKEYTELRLHDRVDYRLYKTLERRKVLRGMYKGVRYNITLLNIEDIKTSDILSVKRIGNVIARARIINSRKAIFTPTIYDIEVIDVSEGPLTSKLATQMYTLDERFKEYLWDDAEVLIEGMLEKVRVKRYGEVEEYFRIHVYSYRHTIIPIRRLKVPLTP